MTNEHPMTLLTDQSASRELGGLLNAIQQRGAHGGMLLVRLRDDGGWEVKNPAEQPKVQVTQADMDMATRGLAIGSDLRREWQLALLFAEHREAAVKPGRCGTGPPLPGHETLPGAIPPPPEWRL